MPVASWAVARYFAVDRSAGPMLAAVAVAGVVIALWRVLPWNPRASLRSKLAAPAFLAGVFVMGRILPGSTVLFYPVAFANGVFLFGFKRGIAYAAATLVVIFVDGALTAWLVLSSPTSWFVVAFNALLIVAIYAAVAVFIVGICMSIVEANRRRQETQILLRELEAANADLKDYSQRVKELTLSEERARMAREMHDSVGHYLTVVNVQLEAATKLMEGDPEKAGERVVKAKTLASEALSEVRRSVRALKPLAVEETSLADALSALARDFESAGPEISFEVEGEERKLSANAEFALYRALQESLTNALKHSVARQISALLTFTKGSVKLTVTDDGVGMVQGAIGQGFGLSALGERVDALGGTMKAGNASGGGFVLYVELPTEPSVDTSVSPSAEP